MAKLLWLFHLVQMESELLSCTSTSFELNLNPIVRFLASGSGDTTVRFWDVNTETPQFTCQGKLCQFAQCFRFEIEFQNSNLVGHKNWVLCISWSPDGRKLSSACKNGQVMVWDPTTGKQIGPTLTGHKKWITCLVWEPLHL